ncbi:MAG: hypothetical protein LBJ35_04995, partial [Spirochaetaceae bacterium]|nr:hypothetical protein [Spirochaetaceae bacterium]
GGGAGNTSTYGKGRDGGSGGGGGAGNGGTTYSGGTATQGSASTDYSKYGKAGGSSSDGTDGGGGGGANSVGGSGVTADCGAGEKFNISGSDYTYAKGGYPGNRTGDSYKSTNYGDGGRGGNTSSAGSEAGMPGIVIVRFAFSE